jgi:hypothetical protein
VDGDPGELLPLALGVGRAFPELTEVTPSRLGISAESPDADGEAGGDDRAERGGRLAAWGVRRDCRERGGDGSGQCERCERDPQLAEGCDGVQRDQHRHAAGIVAEGHDRTTGHEGRREHRDRRRATQHERAAGDDREHEPRRARRPFRTDHLCKLRRCRNERERNVERRRAPAARPRSSGLTPSLMPGRACLRRRSPRT